MAFPSNFKLIRQQAFGSTATADKDVAFRIKYIGPTPTNNASVGGVALAAWDPEFVFVAGTTQTLAFTLDGGVPDTSIGAGTTGIITVASDATVGSVAAQINASANWRMVLLGSLASDLFWDDLAHDYLPFFAVSTGDNARACYLKRAGTEVYFDTNVVTNHNGAQLATLCLGPEAETSEAFAPIHQRMSEENIVYKRDVTDVKDAAFANHIADQPTLQNVATFLTMCSAQVQEADAAATTLTIYAATQTASRTLYTTKGTSHATLADATVKTLASSDLGYDPLMTQNGERIVFRVTAPEIALFDLRIAGGYGYLLT